MNINSVTLQRAYFATEKGAVVWLIAGHTFSV